MRLSRWILLLGSLAILATGAWLWWVRPGEVDMATYAPAGSLIYIEANHPTEVVHAIAGTQAWQAVRNLIYSEEKAPRSRWLEGFVRWTGIGPIKSVILARAQVAVVVTDFVTVEAGDTLNIKSEGALLVETHTSESRIKPVVEEALKTLAEKTYGRPSSRRVILDGVEYVEWKATESSRQIVGVVIGSLVVIGTSEQVVQECLAVVQGRRPSLKADPELHAMRLRLQSPSPLTFGYVPAGNSAKLLAVGLPALLGRAPGDTQFQGLVTNGAAKIFGSLGWTSNRYLTGVEDRYLITLQPSILARLKPAFGSNNIDSQIENAIPGHAYSITSYNFASPAAAWLSFKTAVSSQVDALSAIVFSSLLKSALLSYGIQDADSFLAAADGEILTLRMDENAERSLLIAAVHDRAALRLLLTRGMRPHTPGPLAGAAETFENSGAEFAASLSDKLVVIGSPADVRRFSEIGEAAKSQTSADDRRRMTFFLTPHTVANVVTYTNDSDRVRNFVSAFMAARGGQEGSLEALEQTVSTLPYSVTETTLGERGIERTTRSPLGQFSTLLPFLFPPQPAPANIQRPSQ